MSDITISVGTTLSISAALPATYDKAGYDALSWTLVSQIGSIPSFGGTAQVTEWIPIDTGVVNKKKGSLNYGDMTLPLAQVLSDAGQIMLKSGFDGANKSQPHSVRISNPTIGTFNFTAEISGYTYNFGDANAITQNECTFAVKTKPVVDATELFVLTYSAGTNGAVYGDLSQTVESAGSGTAIFAAPTNAVTHEFTAWSDASTDNPRTDTAVAANITVSATFTAL